ncbi:MAG: hypothetical protein C0456_10485 [Hyphomonas sp.]|nr:hypothetical protein [Hyphomonas sp.]
MDAGGNRAVASARLDATGRERSSPARHQAVRAMTAIAAIGACIAIEFFLARAILEAGFPPIAWCIGS